MEPGAHLATLWALAHAGVSQCHCQPWTNELHASCMCAGSAYSRTQGKGASTFFSILPARAGLGQTYCWVMAKFRGPAGRGCTVRTRHQTQLCTKVKPPCCEL